VALADAGATPEDVVRSVVYVVSSDSAVLARVGYQGQLVELDLTAALPG
jgi:hypothetical protein